MLDYDVVDVFTDHPFAGNALAIVHGAEHLDPAQMQEIAREFNLSETTFPVPRDDSSYDVRIFTASEEVPFAGHPTLGTAWQLTRRGELRPGRVRQHCGVGVVHVDVEAKWARLEVAPREISGPLDPSTLGEALGVRPAGTLRVASCGLAFGYVPVDPAEVAASHVPVESLAELGVTAADPVGGVCVYAVTPTAEGIEVHARVFCPGVGVTEDPATGSCAAGLGLVLAADGLAPDGTTAYRISQGVEIGRPSTLHGEVDVSAGEAQSVRVGGAVVAAAKGAIAVPAAPG